MAYSVSYSSQANNQTPTVGTVATALAANVNRNGWLIQNVGTNALYVCLSATANASSTNYHFVLKAGTAVGDGNGGIFTDFGPIVYQGRVSAGGTGAQYVVLEI